MTGIDAAFGRQMFSEAKKELREVLGSERANILLNKHLDVVGDHGGGYYFLHWVKYPGLFEEDLHYGSDGYKTCGNIHEARANAIEFLLEHLRKHTPRGACLSCKKELPFQFLTRDTIRCPWCGVVEHDYKPITPASVIQDGVVEELKQAAARAYSLPESDLHDQLVHLANDLKKGWKVE